MTPSAAVLHPVVDRTPVLRAVVDRLGLSCTDKRWKGWQVTHRFVCSQGHIALRKPASLLVKGAGSCATCVTKGRLEVLRAAARQAGSTCMARKWEGAHALYSFRCQQSHRWQRSAHNTLRSAACPTCTQQKTNLRKRLPDGLKRLLTAARERGWECLSATYEGISACYLFRCQQGHEWHAQGADVLYKAHWCRHCSDMHKRVAYLSSDGLERLHAAAAERGGRCLAERYTGQNVRYRFRCREGHEWTTLGSRVLRGNWCLQCARQQMSKRISSDGLLRMQRLAGEHGGKCLFDEYLGSAHRYRFRCAEGHEWETFGSAVLRGTWCRKCAGIHRRLGLGAAQRIAAERGGQCLSEEYQGLTSKLHWLCHRGHSWHTTMASIRKGSWCPTCAHQAQIVARRSKARIRYEFVRARS